MADCCSRANAGGKLVAYDAADGSPLWWGNLGHGGTITYRIRDASMSRCSAAFFDRLSSHTIYRSVKLITLIV
jgi:hypothetical protein